jgi:hypothetical protein
VIGRNVPVGPVGTGVELILIGHVFIPVNLNTATDEDGCAVPLTGNAG